MSSVQVKHVPREIHATTFIARL